MSNGIFGDLFDFNGDGNLDALEQGLEFMLLDEITSDDEDDDKYIGESCGYAITLNSADQIKKYSHLFSDVDMIIFDEFQSETNHYCSDEIKKFLSVHTSIARGNGEQVRYVPVYMLGNQVSIINPYYVELGITARLSEEVNFLRGDGFVLENGFIDSASQAQKLSAAVLNTISLSRAISLPL